MSLDKDLRHYSKLQSENIKIDATRGKPCKEQLDFSYGLLNVLSGENCFLTKDNLDTRNYGELQGVREARQLFAEIFTCKRENVFICGNSSLNIMHDLIVKSMLTGVLGNEKWVNQKSIKWLCVVPGYDRHFDICEKFGIEMINVPLNVDGPDVDLIKEYIRDPSVKGIWCVPKFSNPTGTTYSPRVIEELASLKPAAKDFRIYWDNAYAVHDFDQDNHVYFVDIFDFAKKYHTEDMIYEFGSFSKISFAGGSMSALIASKANIEDFKKYLSTQTICYDKVNQLRHARYFKNKKGVIAHMRKHAQILKPKFDFLDDYFSREIGDIASWEKPLGGYFICLKVKNCASEVVSLCKDCGVLLTAAGSPFPYHKDPNNEYLRIAPSCLTRSELEKFADVVCTAIRIETALHKDK